jgi:hypothetical protein
MAAEGSIEHRLDEAPALQARVQVARRRFEAARLTSVVARQHLIDAERRFVCLLDDAQAGRLCSFIDFAELEGLRATLHGVWDKKYVQALDEVTDAALECWQK